MVDLFRRKTPQSGEKQVLIKSWAREHLALAEEPVVVTELHCAEPGCPPLETVIAIVGGPGLTRQWKFHKPASEVTREDIAGME